MSPNEKKVVEVARILSTWEEPFNNDGSHAAFLLSNFTFIESTMRQITQPGNALLFRDGIRKISFALSQMICATVGTLH